MGKRRSRIEQERLVAEYRASGLTQEGFAAQAGINIGTLRGWLYNKQRRSAGEEGGHFAPVRVSGARAGAVTLRWPQGMELEITTELDRAGVVSLVRELLTPCLR
jgi:hypothetical protein